MATRNFSGNNILLKINRQQYVIKTAAVDFIFLTHLVMVSGPAGIILLISHNYAQYADIGFHPCTGNEWCFVTLTVDDKFAFLIEMPFIHR